MSLNLGNDGVAAASALRGNEQWDKLRAAIGALADKKVDDSIGSEVAVRIEQTGYARALRDLWVALECSTSGANPRNLARRPTSHAGLPAEADEPETFDGEPRDMVAPVAPTAKGRVKGGASA